MGCATPLSGYLIRVEGVLDAHWAACFEGLTLATRGDQTVISGPVRDMAELHGLLAKVRDLGLTLVEVRRLPENRLPRGRRRK
jgi:hypothetical protein